MARLEELATIIAVQRPARRIAAHAAAAGLMLVTNNEREFRRIKAPRVENWVG
jgi:predicted nucleic acid-binding protein